MYCPRSITKKALNEFLNNCRFENCLSNNGYTEALGLKIPVDTKLAYN